ncbi:Stk1 family PASTA domain-containing Ser/Thr kinase [Pseudonocardia acaciae]|uniref:Stk1 family PASTA domain-containing Ser/Thr kinase n=1 Tax=Pseudonocardia acaciae TaxID=551276 RepID=UPI000688EB03|nr:Stk1 family PASTA domain-containing Ser/Thr kinase [Pseudonocardia acaciae]
MVAAEHELTGTLLEGRYRIDELLAIGGMSKVYRGTDTRLDRAVAIKVMDAQLASDPSFRGRFEREARAIARIDHPGVIGVYDQGEHGEPPEPLVFLVMELVTGGTLRDVLVERGALDVPSALAVLEPVLGALAAAHSQGLTHRDVKPENVLISDSGAVKVADFGLVTAVAHSRASAAGVILGTVAYLSPEQVTGSSVDARSDVYAAGVLLYELLTGRPPYGGEHALSVAYQHVNEDVPPPSELVPGLPPDLDALVASATRRDRDARPRDAETLLHAVRGVRAALGIPRVAVPLPHYGDAATVPVAARDLEATEPVSARPQHRPGHRPTRALTAMTPLDEDEAWAPDTGPADHQLRRRRGRRVLAAWITGVLLLGVLVGILAWTAGAKAWTATPALAGLKRAAAERAVTDAGLVPAARELPNDTVPVGTVIDSVPKAGSEVKRGSTVTLMVSTGRPRVPFIQPGTTVPEAERLIRAAELVPRSSGSTRRYHPTVPAGAVIGTSPAAGTELASGSTVTVVISSGPPPRREFNPRDIGRGWADEIERQLEDVLGGLPG